MRIKIMERVDSDYLKHERMEVRSDDGIIKRNLGIGPLSECPEDAIIGRDLVSCRDVISWMKMAFEAGQKGEEFNIEETSWEE